MLISDLVRVNPASPVICLREVERLKAELRGQTSPTPAAQAGLRELLEQYFITESDNRQAVEAILHSLAQAAGEAFIIYGPYGAGKSHLLAMASLLAEFPAGWPYFLATHPEFSRFAPCEERKRLVVQIPLDDYSGPDHVLEAIVFDRIEAELASPWHDAWTPLAESSYFLELFEQQVLPRYQTEWTGFLKRRKEVRDWSELRSGAVSQAAELAGQFLKKIGLPLDYRRSRAEAVFSLFEHLKQRQYAGAVLLIDELSTFLASKDKRGLNRDAAFLQFLAQQCEHSPLWIVATAQRSLEEVGDIDSHTLRQIRDRFRGRFALSLAEMRRVLAEKLIEKCDADRFGRQVTAVYEGYAARGRPGFSVEELKLSYPVNPLALDCLEALAGNYLSSTRSLIGMAQKGLLGSGGLLSEEADRLLTLDRVFDLEAKELLALPEAGKFRQAGEFFERNLPTIVAPADLSKAQALMKCLLLVCMAGFRWNSKRIADALIGGNEARLWGDWLEVERILKRIWRRGAYLEAAGSAEAGMSDFFLEVDTDLSELVRRRLNEALAALSDDDERVGAWALQACDGEPLPLAHFTEVHSIGVEWLGVRRYVNVGVGKITDGGAGEPAQRAATLEAPACREDGWLVISPMGSDGAAAKAEWQRQARQAPGRFRSGLLAWLPRATAENEQEVMREYAALNLLLADATLAGSRKGREVRSRLRERLAAAKEECRRVAQRVYMGGEVFRAEEPERLCPAELGAEKWEELLADLFAPVFQRIFPDFAAIAPRQRLVSKLHSNQIVDKFLRPGQAALPPGSPLEEHLVNYLEPLGFLRKEAGRFQLVVTPGPLVEQVLSFVPAPAAEPQPEAVISWQELAGRLRKGSFGLTPELAELVIGALVRTGYLRGLDGFLLPLHLSQAAAPLSESILFLMRASPLSEKEQGWLAAFGKRLFGREAGLFDPAEQEVVWDLLRGWRRRAQAELPEVARSLDSFIATLGQEPINWSASRAALQQLAKLLETDLSGLASVPGVNLLLQAAEKVFGSAEAAREGMERYARLRQFLREYAPALQQAHCYLSDSRLLLAEGSSLAKPRAALVGALASGEAMVPRAAALCDNWEKLRHAYLTRYQAWHAHQHGLARFRPYLELRSSASFRLGERLAMARADETGEFARVAAKLREALARHCAGAALPAGLQDGPVCPECGLRLGEQFALPDPGELTAELTAAVGRMQRSLIAAERMELLRKRLEGESAGELRERLERLLSPRSEQEGLLELLSPDVAEWVATQLGRQVVARRKVHELVARLARKQLTREQALHIFLCWWDEQGVLGEQDLVELE